MLDSHLSDLSKGPPASYFSPIWLQKRKQASQNRTFGIRGSF